MTVVVGFAVLVLGGMAAVFIFDGDDRPDGPDFLWSAETSGNAGGSGGNVRGSWLTDELTVVGGVTETVAYNTTDGSRKWTRPGSACMLSDRTSGEIGIVASFGRGYCTTMAAVSTIDGSTKWTVPLDFPSASDYWVTGRSVIVRYTPTDAPEYRIRSYSLDDGGFTGELPMDPGCTVDDVSTASPEPLVLVYCANGDTSTVLTVPPVTLTPTGVRDISAELAGLTRSPPHISMRRSSFISAEPLIVFSATEKGNGVAITLRDGRIVAAPVVGSANYERYCARGMVIGNSAYLQQAADSPGGCNRVVAIDLTTAQISWQSKATFDESASTPDMNLVGTDGNSIIAADHDYDRGALTPWTIDRATGAITRWQYMGPAGVGVGAVHYRHGTFYVVTDPPYGGTWAYSTRLTQQN